MRAARWIGIALAALLILLIGADRVGVYVAERAAADTLKSSQHLDSAPKVSIGGFPFLTQLVSGTYDRITITADDVPVRGRGRVLTLSRLKVVLHQLSVSRNFRTFSAQTATADASITYQDLATVLGVRLDYAGNGRIRATRTVTAAGRTVHATVTARPRLVHGALTFTEIAVPGLGPLSESAVASLRRIFQVTVPLQDVPFGVRVDSLEATPDGVAIGLSGRDVTYVR
jgi:hypothetical protein